MTNSRTIWHHVTSLTDDAEILDVSPRLEIKWFAAPECARSGPPSGGVPARSVLVELPAVEGVPVIDARDVAGSLAEIDHDLSDELIEAIQYDLDRGGWEADETAAHLMRELTGDRGIVFLNWEGDGDEILIVGKRGLYDARIIEHLTVA